MTLTASSTGESGVVVYSVVPLMRRISLTSMAPPGIDPRGSCLPVRLLPPGGAPQLRSNYL